MKLQISKQHLEEYYISVTSGFMNQCFTKEESEYIRDNFKSGVEIINLKPITVKENMLRLKFINSLFDYFIFDIEVK